jgi:hypothetical protein
MMQQKKGLIESPWKALRKSRFPSKGLGAQPA